jgi:hypothetical protein
MHPQTDTKVSQKPNCITKKMHPKQCKCVRNQMGNDFTTSTNHNAEALTSPSEMFSSLAISNVKVANGCEPAQENKQ